MSEQITGNTNEKTSGWNINDSHDGVISCEHGRK